VNFRYDEDQEELRRTIRRFLAEHSPESVVRRDMQTSRGWDPALYQRLCQEIGVSGLALPEKYGGAEAGAIELGIALQEAGRALLCAPLLSTSIATRTILESGDEEIAARLLPGVADGVTVLTLAAQEGSTWNRPVETRAAQRNDGWQVTGEKAWVLDGAFADAFIVSALVDESVGLFLVEATDAGVASCPLEGVDPTRRQARLTFASARAIPLGDQATAASALERTLQFAAVLLSAEAVGVAERCMEMARDYALQREQFGRAIGSFQAIKHKLANVLLEVEAAVSASMYALWIADEQPAQLALTQHIALPTCTEAALLAASENIQVHGGIGATWEHPAHLYLKRATTNRMLLGDPQMHREQLASKLGLTA
jgi:alkylation response protein AidB-like acyl-CoA dehydrogenase